MEKSWPVDSLRRISIRREIGGNGNGRGVDELRASGARKYGFSETNPFGLIEEIREAGDQLVDVDICNRRHTQVLPAGRAGRTGRLHGCVRGRRKEARRRKTVVMVKLSWGYTPVTDIQP